MNNVTREQLMEQFEDVMSDAYMDNSDIMCKLEVTVSTKVKIQFVGEGKSSTSQQIAVSGQPSLQFGTMVFDAISEAIRSIGGPCEKGKEYDIFKHYNISVKPTLALC
tara:strand:- start:10736 stop:11059 length:324 start_codon:yes stop_codon:yes gene_type:complete